MVRSIQASYIRLPAHRLTFWAVSGCAYSCMQVRVSADAAVWRADIQHRSSRCDVSLLLLASRAQAAMVEAIRHQVPNCAVYDFGPLLLLHGEPDLREKGALPWAGSSGGRYPARAVHQVPLLCAGCASSGSFASHFWHPTVRSRHQLTLLRDAQCNLAFNVTLLYQFVGVSSTNAKAAKSASSSKSRSKKAD